MTKIPLAWRAYVKLLLVWQEPAKREAPLAEDAALVARLAPRLRAKEQEIGARARDLAWRIHDAVGQGAPLTVLGDRVATPLQTQRLAALAAGA